MPKALPLNCYDADEIASVRSFVAKHLPAVLSAPVEAIEGRKALLNKETGETIIVVPVSKVEGMLRIVLEMSTLQPFETSLPCHQIALFDVDTSECHLIQWERFAGLCQNPNIAGGMVRMNAVDQTWGMVWIQPEWARINLDKMAVFMGSGHGRYADVRSAKKSIKEDFVHLHNHSAYSLLDGASTIEGMVYRARANGQPGLALTDHGYCFGSYKFYRECKSQGIKPILGCLFEGQEIVTDTGMKAIEKIKVGDRVLTHKGRFRTVVKTMHHRHRGRVFTIYPARDARPLRVTDEHPVLIRRKDGSQAWLRPGEIDAGRYSKEGGVECWRSWVVLPKLQESVKQIDTLATLSSDWSCEGGVLTRTYPPSIAKWSKPKGWPLFPLSINLDEDFGYLLGLFCAEGSFLGHPQYPTGLCFSFHLNEAEYAAEVFRIIHKLFGLQCTTRSRPEKTLLEVFVSSVPLASLIQSLTGRRAHNKHVPACIFESPKACRLAFVSGLVDGDGKQIRGSNIGSQRSLKVASQQLAWGFRTLIADLGFWSSVMSVTEVVNGVTKTSYSVSYSPDRAFSHTIQDEHMVYKPVERVELEEYIDSRVFNIEVEEDNSYVSDFILHNCEVYLVDDASKRYQDSSGGDRRFEYHQTILCQNNTGWQNLSKLLSKACRDNFYYVPRVDHKSLFEHSEGLIVLSGCFKGPVAWHLQDHSYMDPLTNTMVNPALEKPWMTRNPDHSRAVMRQYKAVFGDRYYIELQNIDYQRYMNIMPEIAQMAADEGIPAVATNDCHYELAEDAAMQALMTRISTSKVDDIGNDLNKVKGVYFLRDRSEMECPTFTPDMLDRTCEIMDRCELDLDFKGYLFPEYNMTQDKDWAAYQAKVPA